MEMIRENVIFDPSDPRVKGLIGKKVMAFDAAGGEMSEVTFVSAYGDKNWPFICKRSTHHACFRFIMSIPSYVERHAEWVKKNNLKVGDKVRVLRKAESREDGWNNSWVGEMDESVGGVFEVDKIGAGNIMIKTPLGYFRYPYFVLEKVFESYRPFKNANEFLPHKDKWVKRKEDGKLYAIVSLSYDDDEPVETEDEYLCYGELFNNYTFDDGSPCGVKE